MTEKKIKVLNPNKFDVGLRLYDGREMNIKGGAFVLLTEAEIEYIASICTLFSSGVLRVEATQEEEVLENLGINKDDEPNFMTDDEIKKKLGMSAQKIKTWIFDLEDRVILHRVADIAKEMDLPQSKMKVIIEKIPDAEE